MIFKINKYSRSCQNDAFLDFTRTESIKKLFDSTDESLGWLHISKGVIIATITLFTSNIKQLTISIIKGERRIILDRICAADIDYSSKKDLFSCSYQVNSEIKRFQIRFQGGVKRRMEMECFLIDNSDTKSPILEEILSPSQLLMHYKDNESSQSNDAGKIESQLTISHHNNSSQSTDEAVGNDSLHEDDEVTEYELVPMSSSPQKIMQYDETCPDMSTFPYEAFRVFQRYIKKI